MEKWGHRRGCWCQRPGRESERRRVGKAWWVRAALNRARRVVLGEKGRGVRPTYHCGVGRGTESKGIHANKPQCDCVKAISVVSH